MRRGREDDGVGAACLRGGCEAAHGVVAGWEGGEEGGGDVGVADHLGGAEGCE